mgnify:CR=1 FL=1
MLHHETLWAGVPTFSEWIFWYLSFSTGADIEGNADTSTQGDCMRKYYVID